MLKSLLIGLKPAVLCRPAQPLLRSLCASPAAPVGSSGAGANGAADEEAAPEWVEAYNRALSAIEANKSAAAGDEEGASRPLQEGAERVRTVDAQGRAYGTGRRKRSVARVWIKEGNGKFTINKRSATDYMSNRQSWMDHMVTPLVVTDKAGRFDIWCTASGGGHTGQAGAIRLGISRALQNFDPNLRPQLKRGETLLANLARCPAHPVWLTLAPPRSPPLRKTPYSRRAEGGAQEAGQEEGPQELPVGETLMGAGQI